MTLPSPRFAPLATSLLSVSLTLSLAACPGPTSGNGSDPRTGPRTEPRKGADADPGGGPARRAQANFVASLLKRERTVQVGALYYRKKGGGGVSQVKIRVGPNPDRVAEVGVNEQWIGGTGGQMKSSVWVAAFMASSALGRELVDYRFSASTRGFVDGPSAGALFTAAMMAAITGASIKPKATMTGTVNPDGSVGPVGGIADKFRGALKLGYRVLGYPVGQRVQKDRQGNLVDLEALAAEGGAKAYPVATLYDAYRILTGRNAPRRFIMSRRSMRLPAKAGSYLRQNSRGWHGIGRRFFKMFKKRGIANKEAVRRMRISLRYLKAADDEAKARRHAAAYEFAARGASFAFTTFHYQDFLLHLKAALKTKNTKLLQLKAQKMFKGSLGSSKAFDRLRRLPKPTSIDQAVAQVAAYSLALENKAYLQGAAQLYKFASVIKAKLKGRLSSFEAKMLSRAITYMGIAQTKSKKSRHLVGLAFRGGRGFRLSGRRLKTISSQVSSMAHANLAYADTVIVGGLVKATKKPKKYWQLMLTNYLSAARNARASLLMNRALNKGTWQWSLAELGAAVSSYLHSSMLLTKLYAVGAFHKLGGQVRQVKRQRALLEMLKHADIKARQAAARARRAIGYVPLMSRYFYEVGRAMSRSGQTLQVKALEMYWRSSLLSQVAVMLARRN